MFDEQEYQVIVENQQLFRQYLDEMREKHPEIFPSGMEKGYSLYGLIKSSKLGLRIRRIQLKATKQIYQVMIFGPLLKPSMVFPFTPIGCTTCCWRVDDIYSLCVFSLKA